MRPRSLFLILLTAVAAINLVAPDFLLLSGLDVYQQRMLTILLLAMILWIGELIPGYATGLVIIALQLAFLSDKGIGVLLPGEAPLVYKDVMASLASPIVVLFLGGFSLASAASKYKLDLSMASALLKPFGTRPSMIMFGIMLITALFSMFMSNTATAAMMLAILTPVLGSLSPTDPAKRGFLLSVPVAANIGGMGTPIGTPPNAIAMKYLTGENAVGFGEWMSFGVPIVVVLIVVSWWFIRLLYRPASTELKLKIEAKPSTMRVKLIFYGTFALTVLLWLTGGVHGMNSYVVAVIPLTVFFVTGLLDKKDIKKFSWEVLWLIAGGISLGDGMAKTGLSSALLEMLPTQAMSPIFLISVLTIIAFMMGNFVSHTVAANVMLPLVATVAVGFAEALPLKGAIVQVALVCSLGMALPISTPPNALAYATGDLETREMLRVGGIVSLVGLVIVWIVASII